MHTLIQLDQCFAVEVKGKGSGKTAVDLNHFESVSVSLNFSYFIHIKLAIGSFPELNHIET